MKDAYRENALVYNGKNSYNEVNTDYAWRVIYYDQ